MTEQEVITRLFELGHFFSADALAIGRVTAADLPILTLRDKVVRGAIRSWQDIMGVALDSASFDVHKRRAIHDGEFGPATASTFEVERCGHPDFLDPDSEQSQELAVQEAVGRNGNWKRCHGIGEFHCAVLRMDQQPPAHVRPGLKEIMTNVVNAYRQVGLQILLTGQYAPWDDGNSNWQLDCQFVDRSSGWIGLAQVALNQSCTSKMWNRYLSTYMRSASLASIIRMWSVLFMHEIGHNTGSQHTNGGVMNPSILSLSPTWIGDPAHAWYRLHYGGEAVPTDPQPPQPPTPGPSPYSLQGHVELMHEGVSQGKFMLVPVPSSI